MCVYFIPLVNPHSTVLEISECGKKAIWGTKLRTRKLSFQANNILKILTGRYFVFFMKYEFKMMGIASRYINQILIHVIEKLFFQRLPHKL